MPDKLETVSNAKPNEGSLELTEDLMRIRAYYFYEKRGGEHGHDLEDWLQAEAEIVGKKSSATAELEATEVPSSATAA
jgi:hypothetical protein